MTGTVPLAAATAIAAAASAVGARAALRAGRAGAARRRLPRSELSGVGARADMHRLPPAPAPVEWLLVDAGVGAAAATAWWSWLTGLGLAAAAALLMLGPPAAALTVAAGVVIPAIALRARRGRADVLLEATLPAGLEEVARSLRSGASLRQAIEEAASAAPVPLRTELARVANDTAGGMPLVRALETLAARRPLPGVTLATAALCLGVESGGAQARAVDSVAATLRERLAVEAELRALSAHARYSALVISLAPLVFAGFAAVTDPRTAQFLFRTPAGVGLLCAGMALDGLGALWMRRLARVAA